MNAAIRCLMRRLDSLPVSAGLAELFQAVTAQPVMLDDVRPHIEFDLQRYHREFVAQTDSYQILILAWLPGQKSPIHNHRGSQCCVRVLQGIALETVYLPASDGSFKSRIQPFPQGSVFGGEDADIHTLENAASAPQGLITMHVYRPALTRMELFSVENGRLVR